tara:strand:+ start:185 stop:766 length:582 start_codon:yes stop_codon:yes gene_type:complete
MRQETNIVLLPTNDYPAIAQSSIGYGQLYGWVTGKIRTPHTLVHMYFTSNDKVMKEDTWVITDGWEVLNIQDFVSITTRFRENCKKIIATTDKSLTIDLGHLCLDNLPRPTDLFVEEYCKSPMDTVMVEYHDQEVKIDEMNYITISPIKETYTRAEVNVLINKLQSIPVDSYGEHIGIPETWKNTIDMWCAPL